MKNRVIKKNALKNQTGTAMFAAIMMLTVSTGLALLAIQVATTELQISGYSQRERSTSYLAESGAEQVLSWIMHPDRSPRPDFFKALPDASCSGKRDLPDFRWRSPSDRAVNPFSELGEVGEVIDLRLYRPLHPAAICTVETTASSKGATGTVRVEITKSPLPPITAGVQGKGKPAVSSPVWVHWGAVRYTQDARLGRAVEAIPEKVDALPDSSRYRESGPNQDPWLEVRVEGVIQHPPGDPRRDGKEGSDPPYPERPNVTHRDAAVSLDAADSGRLKEFIKLYGRYYVVSPSGRLEQNGVEKGTFDELFHRPGPDYDLVWIDRIPGYSSPEPIRIGEGSYQGYFYFAGDIEIKGERPGRSVQALSPPWRSIPRPVALTDINLDGFFYALGRVDLQGPFSVYGALFAGEGFAGPAAGALEVWYNHRFSSANYSGLPPVARLKGTWLPIPAADLM